MEKSKRIRVGLVLSAAVILLTYQQSLFASEKEARVQGSLSVSGIKPNQFPSLAKIKTQEAANLALQAHKGNVLSIGLENEDGFLVYAVEVAGNESGIHEILVDAGDGKLLADTSKNSKHDKDREDEEDGDDD